MTNEQFNNLKVGSKIIYKITGQTVYVFSKYNKKTNTVEVRSNEVDSNITFNIKKEFFLKTHTLA